MKLLGPNLATCQLATCTENAVKLGLQLNNKNGRENETKTRWEWSGRHNKNDMERGSVNKN